MSYYNYNVGVTSRDLYILSAAATGAAINRASTAEELKNYMLFGGAAMALPAGIKAGKTIVWDIPKWGYQNWGNYGNAFKDLYQNSIGKTTIFPANRAPLKGKFWDTVNNNYLQNKLKQTELPAFDLTTVQGAKKAEIYKEVTRLTEEAKGLKGKELAAKLKEIEIAKTQAKIAENNAKAAGELVKDSKIGRAASWVKTKSGVRAVETKVLEGTISSNKAVKILSKGAKAGGAMAAISAALEVPTVVKTYKELGAAKGTKQLGKSAVKVAADTAGFAIGAKLGGIAGAKIGATIGTCIGGPIGTAIGGAVGAIIGIAGGLLGSWLAGKAAKAVVGKDELEIAQEEETKKLAEAAKYDPELQAQLAVQASENLQNGNVASAQDAKDIAQSYENVVTTLTEGAAAGDLLTQNPETGYDNTTLTTPAGAAETTTTPATSTQTATLTTDSGLNALFALAEGNVYTSMNNSFMMPFGQTSTFNPFMTGYNNTTFNPFMNNYFNPFSMGYGNLAA